MRVLYCHQHFGLERGSLGTRSFAFARALIERGHEVTMVCGSIEGNGLDLPPEPSDSVRRGRIEGIDVIELVLPYSNYDNLKKRSLTFLRYAGRSVDIGLREEFDLIFATSTPLTAGIPGVVTKWIRGKPFVFEVRDLWPEAPKSMGVVRNPVVLWALGALEWICYRSADACVGLSPGMVRGIENRSEEGKRITLIPNGCDFKFFPPPKGGRIQLQGVEEGDFTAVFLGTHGRTNGLNAVLDAARVVREANRKEIKFIFIGDGLEKPDLMARATRDGLDNCLFFDPMPKVEAARTISNADVGLQAMADVPAFYDGTSPNKFFDYLAAGLPVLNNYPGWVANMITEHNCGVVVPPRDPEAFAEALFMLAEIPERRRKMGRNARSLGKSQFDRDLLAGRFVDLLESVFEYHDALSETNL